MTNEQVEKGFNEVYNQFWRRYRDRVPDRNSDEWERFSTYSVVLQKKYPFLQDAIIRMVIELDERMRGRGYEKDVK